MRPLYSDGFNSAGLVISSSRWLSSELLGPGQLRHEGNQFRPAAIPGARYRLARGRMYLSSAKPGRFWAFAGFVPEPHPPPSGRLKKAWKLGKLSGARPVARSQEQAKS